jgi:hypothetical protein
MPYSRDMLHAMDNALHPLLPYLSFILLHLCSFIPEWRPLADFGLLGVSELMYAAVADQADGHA